MMTFIPKAKPLENRNTIEHVKLNTNPQRNKP